MEQRTDALDQPQRDLWFNPHLGPRGIPAHNVIGVPVLAVKTYKRKRALRGKNLDTLYGTLIALLANLIYHHLIGSHGQGIPVPRSKKALGKRGNRYQPSFPRSFPRMLDALCDLGYAKETKGKFSGFPGQSKRTTVRAGPKLIELIKEHKVALEDLDEGEGQEIIILSRAKHGQWDEGGRIDYPDTERTRRFREELRGINSWLAKAEITFDPKASNRPVDIHARQLRRQFTLGRFEFDRGGRLFGGFWETLPKPVRLRGIRIEGEPVVGLDYSQLNPLLSYHVAEADPPAEDAYTLPGLEKHRDGVKKVFNAMLFKHPVTKFPKGARALFPRRVKCEDVTEAILLRHPMLKGVLSYPETGHQLQFLESEIMMAVLRSCQGRNIVALPVFDCVVVKASAEDVVTEIMCREFKAVGGFDVTVKRELPSVGSLQADAAGEIDARDL
jgi:hypothetical protein